MLEFQLEGLWTVDCEPLQDGRKELELKLEGAPASLQLKH